MTRVEAIAEARRRLGSPKEFAQAMHFWIVVRELEAQERTEAPQPSK